MRKNYKFIGVEDGSCFIFNQSYHLAVCTLDCGIFVEYDKVIYFFNDMQDFNKYFQKI